MCYFLYNVCSFPYILKFLENFAFAFSYHAPCCISVLLCVSFPGVLFLPFLGTCSDKLSHQYNSRANQQKKMNRLEQESRELCEEVNTLRDSMEMLSTMMEALEATQN